MELTNAIIYIQNKVKFKKNINLHSQDFDGTDVKQYYSGFLRNIKENKENVKNLTLINKKCFRNIFSQFNYI